jgi:NAD(P)-dependent dehydrogenase (short-subunit alcohol dehydrogenase family)
MKAEIQALGRNSLMGTADVTNRDQVRAVIEATKTASGGIDVLLNRAGTSARIPSLDLPQERWDEILDVNLNGTWYACQIAGEIMKEQGGGKIINIASLSSFVALKYSWLAP